LKTEKNGDKGKGNGDSSGMPCEAGCDFIHEDLCMSGNGFRKGRV
jgi:hypothetical protein